ncbi:MAG: hypothetical protein AAFX05_11725, partial [Planctomycetota bacterium]
IPLCPNPQNGDPPVLNVECLTNVPTENLILDVYLDRRLARASIPSAGVYRGNVIGPVAARAPDDAWYDRLAETPSLEHLGQGLSRAAARCYPRHAELNRFLFDHMQWSPNRFIGLRLALRYPIPGVSYVITLDFGDA